MAEQTIQPEQVAVADPALHRTKAEPKGVMKKNAKVWIFLGASAVVVAAAAPMATEKEGRDLEIPDHHK